jgi:putative tricarboxylic transport membrane protein
VRRVDIGIGAFFILFGAFGVIQSLQLPLFQRGGIPGPGMFPLVLSIALVVLGGLLVATRVLQPNAEYPEFEPPRRYEVSRVVAAMVAMGVSIALLPVVGYFLSSVALVAFLLLGIERLRSWRVLLTTVALPAFFYIVFVVLLRVRLPAGFFDS